MQDRISLDFNFFPEEVVFPLIKIWNVNQTEFNFVKRGTQPQYRLI